MRLSDSTSLLAGLLLAAPLAAADGDPLEWFLSVHTAMPMANLSTDVDGKLGFGFNLGFEQPLSRRVSVRGSFSWTGYRVDDRNLWEKAFASHLRGLRVLRVEYVAPEFPATGCRQIPCLGFSAVDLSVYRIPTCPRTESMSLAGS